MWNREWWICCKIQNQMSYSWSDWDVSGLLDSKKHTEAINVWEIEDTWDYRRTLEESKWTRLWRKFSQKLFIIDTRIKKETCNCIQFTYQFLFFMPVCEIYSKNKNKMFAHVVSFGKILVHTIKCLNIFYWSLVSFRKCSKCFVELNLLLQSSLSHKKLFCVISNKIRSIGWDKNICFFFKYMYTRIHFWHIIKNLVFFKIYIYMHTFFLQIKVWKNLHELILVSSL